MYSQREEQPAILAACAKAKRPRVLDIGAWHATDKSNSRALIEAGWNAVLIEPSPGPLRGLVEAYGYNSPYHMQVEIVAAAASCENGLVELQITDDAVSTPSPTSTWVDKGGYFGTLFVPALTIDDILNRFGEFDCVSIDTEGTSVDLFHRLIARDMYPACIVVEHDGRYIEAVQAARARHYRPVYESQENLVFALVDV